MKTRIWVAAGTTIALLAATVIYWSLREKRQNEQTYAVLEKKCGESLPSYPTQPLSTSPALNRPDFIPVPYPRVVVSVDARQSDEDVWKTIEPRVFRGIFSGKDEALKKAALAMRDGIDATTEFMPCVKRFSEKRPPEVSDMEYNMIINVEVTPHKMNIRGAEVESSTISDQSFEECFMDSLKRLEFENETLNENGRYRFSYPFRWIFEAPPIEPGGEPLSGDSLAKASQDFKQQWEQAKKKAEEQGVPIEEILGKGIVVKRSSGAESAPAKDF